MEGCNCNPQFLRETFITTINFEKICWNTNRFVKIRRFALLNLTLLRRLWMGTVAVSLKKGLNLEFSEFRVAKNRYCHLSKIVLQWISYSIHIAWMLIVFSSLSILTISFKTNVVFDSCGWIQLYFFPSLTQILYDNFLLNCNYAIQKHAVASLGFTITMVWITNPLSIALFSVTFYLCLCFVCLKEFQSENWNGDFLCILDLCKFLKKPPNI